MGKFVCEMDDRRDRESLRWPTSERREKMEYLADLLGQMLVLAELEGCEKLPALLAVSRAEAMREMLRSTTPRTP